MRFAGPCCASLARIRPLARSKFELRSAQGCCKFDLRVVIRIGAPGKSRTCNRLIRSQVLYPLSHGRSARNIAQNPLSANPNTHPILDPKGGKCLNPAVIVLQIAISTIEDRYRIIFEWLYSLLSAPLGTYLIILTGFLFAAIMSLTWAIRAFQNRRGHWTGRVGFSIAFIVLTSFVVWLALNHFATYQSIPTP